eukprot:Hpha_TRINITY_DN8896_c0_g1::TRINITY_DN8896_c0_g1_i1::g.141403::m.141403
MRGGLRTQALRRRGSETETVLMTPVNTTRESDPGAVSLPTREDRRRAIGFRSLFSMFTMVPFLVLIWAIPVVAMWLGDVEAPDVLLSSMIAKRQVYAAGVMYAFLMCCACVIFTVREYSLYLCGGGETLSRHRGRSLVEFPGSGAEDLRAPVGHLLIVFCFGVFPMTVLTMGFQLMDPEMRTAAAATRAAGGEVSVDVWLCELAEWIHETAAHLGFVCCALFMGIYLRSVHPRVSGAKAGPSVAGQEGCGQGVHAAPLEPAGDLWWKAVSAQLLIIGVLALLAGRCGVHMGWCCQVFRAYTALLAELLILTGAGTFLLFGFRGVLGELDASDPIVFN